MVVGDGFEPSKPEASDLQSDVFDHSTTQPSASSKNYPTFLPLGLVPRGGIEPSLAGDLVVLSPLGLVPRGGIEPPTQGFSVPCSTD